MSNVSNCVMCGIEFIKRHSNHVTCKSPKCISDRKKLYHTEWRYSTGRSKPKDNLWSDDDISFLHNNRYMVTKDIADKLNRTINSVKEKRSRLKLPQLSLCVVCGNKHHTINQHHTCMECVPNQIEYASNYRNGLNGRWMMYKSNAKKRGLPFEISLDQFSKFWQKPCKYCGSEIKTIGIDRVDSSVGYVEGNLVPCCSICNQSKNNLTLPSWITHLKSVLINLGETI